MIKKQKVTSSNINAILSMIFSDIMFKLGINQSVFQQKISKYIANVATNKVMTNKTLITERSSLKKELLSPEMTWKVFCKGINFLGYDSFQLKIDIYHNNGTVTTSEKEIMISTSDTNNVKNSLSDIYYGLLFDLNISKDKFNNLLDSYLSLFSNDVFNTLNEKLNEKRKLLTQIFNTTMTWKVFCKGIKIINVVKFKMVFTLIDKDGKTLIHEQVITTGV